MWHFPRGGPHTNLTRTTPWVAIKLSRTGAVKEPVEQVQLTEDSGGRAEQLSQASSRKTHIIGEDSRVCDS